MALAEGTQGRVVYKAYAVGTMDSNSQPVSTVDPGNTGGQVLRRTSVSMNLEKDTYQAAEIVLHRQITDFRHGVKRVNGSINGELSCGTYWDFLEAVCRGTETASVALSNTELATVTSDSTTSKFTFGADPVAAGLRVGHVLRFTNLATTANNTTNFIITGFSGVNNVDVTVYPAPTTGASDATFNVVQTGKTVSVPDTGHVSRKFAVETYYIDADIYRLFTECRVGGFNMTLPATGLATVEMPFMGRGMETGSAGSAPFFASPTAPTTTGINAAVNGLIRVQGDNLGVVTGATINFALAPVADPVVGQNFVPEIFLGRANVNGQITAMLEDFTLVDYFVNETEVEILLFLTSGTSATADAFTIYMPRVKFGGASVAMDGEAAQIITMPFQALKLGTATLGKPATTIQFSDTAAV
jgi:Phage tail tube protein